MTVRGGRVSPRQWLLAAIAVVCVLALPLWAQMLPGSWNLTASLNQARGGHAAASLPNGQALIVGGTDANGHALTSAEVYNAATDAFTALSGGLTTAASGLTATALNDGTVLVAGGTDDSGNALATVQVFDPNTTAFITAPSLSTARSHHTATLLADGTVLIAGGTDGTNALGSIEIFNPSTRTIAVAASQLAHPRKDHTATLLADGRVLIAGGADSNGPLTTAEVYNPADGSVTPAGALASARTMAAASRLIDGTVLIEGGQDANSAALNSPEIYDPAANAFAAVTAPMVTARASHLGVTLPNNGRVLIAGGTASGQPVGATEVYDPLTGTFIAMGQFNTARSGFGANFFVLPMVGRLLASGGFDSTGTALASTEMFSFPTIMSDQPDYPPGSTVTITGAGWTANEPVSVDIHESDNDADTVLGETADATGAFSDTFLIQTNDGGVSFLMTATGATSGWTAQNKFTDSGAFSYSPSTTQSFTIGAGGSGSFVQSVTAPKNNGTVTATLSVSGGGGPNPIPAAWISTSSCSAGTAGSPCTLSLATGSAGDTESWTVNINVPASPAPTPATYTGTIKASSGDVSGGPGTGISVTVTSAASTSTTLVSSANPSVFGQPVTYTATVTSAPNNPTCGTVTFAGPGVTFANSVVTLSGGNTAQTDATFPAIGTYSITATYAPTLSGCAFTGSSSGTGNPLTQLVHMADTTTTLASSGSPTDFGQSVTFTATVSVTAPGAGTPTGTVQFYDGGSPLGLAVTLSGGQAKLTTSALPAGTRSITATYSGDSNFNTSTSSPLSQVVNQGVTDVHVTLTPSTTTLSQAVKVDFTVSAEAPASGTPTGDVNVSGAGGSCGPVTLSAGAGSCMLTPTMWGLQTITATYGGDTNFAGNFGQASLAVNADTTTTITIPTPADFGVPVTFTATVKATNAADPTCGTVTFSTLTAGVHFVNSTVTLSNSNAASTGVTFDGAATYGNITASYTPGNTSCYYNASPASAPVSQVINPAQTSTTITSIVPPTGVLGQSVTVHYSVANTSLNSAAAIPGTDTVTVTDDLGDSCAATTVAAGSCTLTPSASGSRTVTAKYKGSDDSGDPNFHSSTSAGTALVVNADTSTTLSPSVNPSVFGQPVTLTATVIASAGPSNPTCGTVTFSSPSNAVHFANSPAQLSGNSAQTGVTFDSAGTYSITAAYAPAQSGCFYNGSNMGTGNPFSQVVNRAATTTAVGADVNPSVFGQTVTFTATVTVNAPGAGSPTGTVIFTVDGTPQQPGVALGMGGTATYSTSTLPVTGSPHSVSAAYGGDTNFVDSMGSLAGGQTVNKADTLASVTSNTNPSVAGQSIDVSVSVTAKAPGSGTPSGSVTVDDGFGHSCTVAALSAGTGTCNLTIPNAGNYTLTPAYSGDGSFNATGSGGSSVATAAQTVNKADTDTSITSNTPNPSVSGQSVTVAASVAAKAPGSGTPTGTVTISDGSGDSCVITLVGGSGSCGLVIPNAGGYTLKPTYNGDANFNATGGASTRNSVAQTVNKADTATTIVSNTPSTSVTGQSVLVSVSVAAMAPGSGTPTGSVTVSDGHGDSCVPIMLAGGTGSCTIVFANAGQYTLTASCLGDSNFNASDGTAGQTVNPAMTATIVASSENPSVFGDSVTFTATVAAAPPGGGIPDGSVQFVVDGSPFGSVMLVGGSAGSGSTATLDVPHSAHSVKAIYSGSPNYVGSNALLAGGQTVKPAATTPTVTVTCSNNTPSTPCQYSDPVTFSASITPDQVEGVAPAASVTFKVGTQTIGTVALAADGSGNLTATLADVPLLEPVPFGTAPTGQMAPGNHTVTAVFNGVSPDFTVTNPTTNLTIKQEDAGATYTGALFASTSSPTSTSATITLSATIQDASALANSDLHKDAYPGDIRNALVTFVNRDSNSPISGCTNLPVGLVNDTTVGTSTCQWPVAIQCSTPPCSQTYTVGMIVSGYYMDNASTEDAVVDVSQPGSNFITGGGYLNVTSSAGQVAGALGSKNNFGFNVKYNKNLTNLQGNINTIVRSNVPPMSCPQTQGIHTYQVKGNSMTSLAVQANQTGGTATFNGKASIQDITNPAAPCSVDGNATLQAQMTDNGTPGTNDLIGITVWNKSGGLWFSSNWNGTQTMQQNLGGGNLTVH